MCESIEKEMNWMLKMGMSTHAIIELKIHSHFVLIEMTLGKAFNFLRVLPSSINFFSFII